MKLVGNGSLGEGARVNVADHTLCVESCDNLDKKTRRRARVAAAKIGAHFTRSVEGMIMRKFFPRDIPLQYLHVLLLKLCLTFIFIRCCLH